AASTAAASAADTAPVGPGAPGAVAQRGAVAGSPGPAAGAERIACRVDGSATRRRPAAVVATVHVTVPAATALGLDEQPGELAGHGPVPASMARRLAGTGSWRKVTTDPESGVVTSVGRRTYTPAAALADLVRARDRTCRFPGCRQPARRCDLDHVVRWPDGPTDAANLAALCRHHHRLKHQTQWTVRAGPGADLEWIAPTGHRYVTSPAS
ncbi:MAG TPA: HNH endonuclease signature motif containing protein, partial [Mycobacteriales bacterium]|nr:HNH endonuclease signature motif containing protein [Mycobacteriales bacterium]